MNSPGVSISLVMPIRKTIVQQGHEWEAFCQFAQIDPNLLQNAERRVGEAEFEHIVEAAAAYTKDEAFGLHQGQLMSISDLGVLGYVMLHSKTIGEALTAYRKYNITVCSNFNVELEVNGEELRIHLFLGDSRQPSNRHCMEDMTTSVYHLMEGLSGRPIPLSGITFMHGEPKDLEEYVRVLGIIPQFRKVSNTLILSREVLDYPLLSADPRLLGIFETIAEEVAVQLTQGSPLSNELTKWIIESMPTRFPTLQEAAQEMRFSVRTLQARLKQEQTSYLRLANEVRKQLALRYLAHAEYTIGEIAYLLHFSEPSAFQSAFRKWTGGAPGEYRQRLKGELTTL